MSRFETLSASLLAVAILASVAARSADAPPLTNMQRDGAREMLQRTVIDLKKNYYDASFHGIDIDAREKQAEERIRSAKTYGEAFAAIAWTLDALNDSHTFFFPPPRPYSIENGWELTFIGDKCFVTAVKPGSDADKKGMKVGDQVLSIEGFQPQRAIFWKVDYVLNGLAPRAGMHFVLASPGAQPRQLDVMAEVKRLKRVEDFTGTGGGTDMWETIRRSENYQHSQEWRWVETEDDVMALKIPSFFASDSQIDNVLGRMRKHKSLIIDLRGDPGGAEDVLTQLLGGIFRQDVTIATRVGRKDRKPVIAKGHGDHAFDGKLVVLIDSHSASCSELLARTVQLEKRGTVLGDKSAGAVMEARVYPEHLGVDTMAFYGVQITASNLLMGDGNSLEHNGVTPDVPILPTAEDLANDRDPQMAEAFKQVGGKISPEKAGKLFPVIWRMN
jgi:C-terminal processing protease CtpA/Prc